MIVEALDASLKGLPLKDARLDSSRSRRSPVSNFKRNSATARYRRSMGLSSFRKAAAVWHRGKINVTPWRQNRICPAP